MLLACACIGCSSPAPTDGTSQQPIQQIAPSPTPTPSPDPQPSSPTLAPDKPITLQESKPVPNHDYLITINIESNHLTLFDKGVKIASYKVATGQIIDGRCLTPIGKFTILNKVPEPYWGGNGGTPIEGGDPSNPLGHYWMGTSAPPDPGSSIGIHGNISYDSIGTHASRGCIRMYNTDVPKLFNTVTVGTKVWIGTNSTLSNWGVTGFE